MTEKCKYIVFEDDLGLEVIIVFPNVVKHSDIKVNGNIVSAGFITRWENGLNYDCGYTCYGKSISLGVESRPEKDAKIAKRQLATMLISD